MPLTPHKQDKADNDVWDLALTLVLGGLAGRAETFKASLMCSRCGETFADVETADPLLGEKATEEAKPAEVTKPAEEAQPVKLEMSSMTQNGSALPADHPNE